MKYLFIILAQLFIFSHSSADNLDTERNNLAKLSSEIKFLIQRIDQIKTAKQADQRYYFNYEMLKGDLILIRNGIDEYINQTLKIGRVFQPVSGHYHQHTGRK
jgi:RAQPRD family integrative conjugative element protein